MTVYHSAPLLIYLWLICIEHRISESASPPSLSLKTNLFTLIKVGLALTLEAVFPLLPNVHLSARIEL